MNLTHCQHVLLKRAPSDLDNSDLFDRLGTCAAELSSQVSCLAPASLLDDLQNDKRAFACS